MLQVVDKQINFPKYEPIKLYNAAGQEITGYQGISHTESKQVTAVMSNRYTIIQHEEAYNMIKKITNELGCECEEDVRFLKNGSLMKVEYSLPEIYNLNINGDILETKLVGMNSVDGSKTLSFGIDFLRQVCSNGMVGWVREFDFSQKHTKQLSEKEEIGYQLVAKIQTALETTQNNVQLLMGTKLDFDKGMTLIKEMVDRKVLPQKLESFIEDFWKNASNDRLSQSVENGQSLWTLYNSVTAAVTHHTNKKGKSMPETQQDNVGSQITKTFLRIAKVA